MASCTSLTPQTGTHCMIQYGSPEVSCTAPEVSVVTEYLLFTAAIICFQGTYK